MFMFLSLHYNFSCSKLKLQEMFHNISALHKDIQDQANHFILMLPKTIIE